MNNIKNTILLVLSLNLISCVPDSGKRGSNQTSTTSVATPTSISPNVAQNKTLPIYNIYIENSGSMYGYVKGVTEFEQSVYSYLSDIKISKLTDTLNLYYINSKIIPQGTDVSDFIEKLEPNTFKLKGGNMASSDISDNLKMILNESKQNTVSVFVSDCIFSPGSGKNAQQYLVNQQIGIKILFANYIKDRDIAVMIYQLSSKFDGQYFNKNNKPTYISSNRPFYIWVIGNKSNISMLQAKVKQEKFKGSGVKNAYTLVKGNSKVDFGVLQAPKFGTFERDKSNAKRHIINIKKETNGKNADKFMFSVGVDFSKIPLNNEYKLDKSNYQLNDKDYSIEIDNYKGPLNYTHILKLTTKIIKNSNLVIELKNKLPNWVDLMNDNDGIDINKDGAINKTFGIKYLIGGVYDAFTNGIGNDNYTQIEIKIN